MKIEGIYDEKTNKILLIKKSVKHQELFFIGIAEGNNNLETSGIYLSDSDLNDFAEKIKQALNDDK